MLKRISTLSLMFTLLLASTSTTLNVNAASPNNDPPTQEQAKSEIDRVVEAPRKVSSYDSSGRVTKTVITVSNEKVEYNFKYDNQNRLQYLERADGTQVRLEYDSNAQLQGFSFSDIGRVLFIRDKDGKVIGLRREKKAISRYGDRGALFVNAALVADCQEAIRDAGYAAAAAVLVCSGGTSLDCALAVAVAAEMAYRAYKACKAELEEVDQSST